MKASATLPLLFPFLLAFPPAAAAADAGLLALDGEGHRLARSQGFFVDVIDLRTTRSTAPSFPGLDPAWTARRGFLVVSREHEGRLRLFEVDDRGRSARLITDGSVPGDERGASVSGTTVYFSIGSDDAADLYRTPLAGGTPVRMTRHEARESQPRVSPDGSRVAFVSNRTGGDEIWVMETSVPFGEMRRVTFAEGDDADPAWSPDGARLAHTTIVSGERWIAVVDANGGERQLVRRNAMAPVWSRDGASIYGLVATPLPPDYNGNPRRLDEKERAPLFPHGAFDVVSMRAPDPLNGGARWAATRSFDGASRFDLWLATLKTLYARAGAQADVAFARLAERFRPIAAAARTEAAFEDVTDSLLKERPTIKPEASSSRGVVVSAHPIATAAGLEVLRRGGTVVDAAIAVSFALGVVEEDASGLGGEGMMLVHQATTGRTVAIDFKDQVPIEANLSNPRVFEGDRLVASGPASVNIPGVVAGMDLAYRKYASGRIAWKDLIEPAIRAAEDGFVLDESLPSSIREGQRFLRRSEAAAKIFLPNGRPPKPGETFRNPDYAATLRRIASEGAADFYRGGIARRIAADMRKNGGILTEDDLAQYRAIEREPLRGRYGAFEVVTAPPPVTAGVSLLQTLQILDHAPRENRGRFTEDAAAFHFMAESWKRAGRGNLAADPAFFPVDLTEALSAPWARKQFETIKASMATPDPESPEDPQEDRDYRRERIGTGTTAAVVMDSEGNMVALTQTLSTWGGAFYVSEGLGFLYNNHLRSFRREPRRFNSLTPLARAATGIAPTLVFRRDGDRAVPLMAVGAAGNAWISAAVFQILTGVLDSGLGPQQAVEQPRFLVGRAQFPLRQPPVPSRILYEDLIPRRIVDEMTARGHRLQSIGLKGELIMGYASVAVRDPATGLVRGGADPRRAHRALGLEATAGADAPSAARESDAGMRR